jgi:hypothetical protein
LVLAWTLSGSIRNLVLGLMQMTEALPLVSAAAAQLLGITLAVVALAPLLADSGVSSRIRSNIRQRQLASHLAVIGLSVLCFSASLVCSLLYYPIESARNGLASAAFFLLVFGVAILTLVMLGLIVRLASSLVRVQ